MVSYKALNTTNESSFPDAHHAVRQCKFGQAAATLESLAINFF